MSVPTARRPLNLLLLGPLLAAGCGGKSVALAEVSGTLSWQGAPLENVLVEFIPDEHGGTTGPRSAGVTDAAGRFALRCTDGRPGAVVGRHRVVLAQAGRPESGGQQRDPRKRLNSGAASPGDTAPAVDPVLLALYRSPTQTPVRKEVQPGTQTINLTLP
jgi:hypothetical protein